MKQKLILGPPGTGKTTTLLNIVQEAFDRGIAPEEIAYVSFTRKAAYEARDRAIEQFSHVTEENTPWFSTLHSIGFRIMGLNRKSVMQREHWREVGQLCNLNMTGNYNEAAASGSYMFGFGKGDKIAQMYNVARACMMDPVAYHRSLEPDDRWEVQEWEVRRFVAQLERFKQEGLFDFADMLDYLDEPIKGLRIAIIDEAQDLSLQQWRAVKHIFSQVEHLYIAGDDDQAIYEWSGAHLPTFLSLEGEREVLNKSYRLPERIWQLSNLISGRIKQRYEKDWMPDEREGYVKMIGDHKLAPILEGGEWLVLGRTNNLLKGIQEWLRREGVPFAVKGRSQVELAHVEAIKSWQALCKGRGIKRSDAQTIYDLMHGNRDIKRGYKTAMADAPEDIVTHDILSQKYGLMVGQEQPWFHALHGIDTDRRFYYRALLARKEKWEETPRVNVSTIHSIKGGEADNVLLLDAMTNRPYNALRSPKKADSEHRVFYVGASRAKEKLYILGSNSDKKYRFPRVA